MSSLVLPKHRSFPGVSGPVVVVVMDGIGVGKHNDGNAVWLARTPHLDWLAVNAPSTTLAAHGKAAGLPSDDDMGNSEVGHNALGAGRVFDQGAKLVNNAIADGSLFEGEAWRLAIARVKNTGKPLHFMGLLSDGNVHSHIDHLAAMLKAADAVGVEKVRIHALIDGRDVPQTSALTYVERIERELAAINGKGGRDYRVASGGGRMKITMDRYEADWPMVERGWRLHVRGEGRGFPSLEAAIKTLREEDPAVIDQNLPGFVIVDGSGKPVGPIEDGSAVLFFNFRGDRAIEITRAFEDPHFDKFDRGPKPDVFYAGMMQYDGDLQLPKRFLVPPPAIDRTLGEYLVAAGKRSYASSETQKYGHVTYFWNGNRSGKFDDARETYFEVPSDTLPFEERPWMKASEITDALIAQLKSQKHDFYRINYANGDMVGHTGVRDASIMAVEAVDLSIGRLLPVVKALNGVLLVTADHGNADEMYELVKKTGAFETLADGSPKPKTSHTLNPVPFHVYAPGYTFAIDTTVQKPGLANMGATVLHLLGLSAPEDYLPSLIAG
ncbi:MULTISPECIES: 2,3-bisphosphoglycerate-independent phosphoglycerate mutase [Sorangium]|uniref:2,3-bisphosphoglycerate-independent phosphoglycerate mutase n=1 Tax=Sorangium cellulosum (strain So ce56) TaxID=448385 RepID=A9F8K5_SORC5|nr:2,3-bisphosphoglycerate-independent phosphoglycerate mutase [Sorangium cellulosum]CAN94665.1 Phosphoglycerate mutase [Sorangium cellulosum So ce56]